MNQSKMWLIISMPIALIMALLVAIPLLFSEDCDPATSGATGPTSNAISVMSWNLCTTSCANWDRRVGPSVNQVAETQPDILATQEAGWRKSIRTPTFKGFASLGYANATTRAPFIGRYLFYKPAKFSLEASGSFSLGGNHGMAWAHLKTKADNAEFIIVDAHLVNGKSGAADNKRKQQMATGVSRIGKVAGGMPTIWAGDFNSNKSRRTDSPGIAFKAAGITDSVKLATQKSNADVNSARARNATAKVKTDGNQTDHIYVSRGVTVARWNQSVVAKDANYVAPFISDHNAIMATVGVPAATPTSSSIPSDQAAAAPALDSKSPVGRWTGDQIKNASAIVSAGKALDLNQRGQTIAVMTAMGESSLNAIDHGDTAGPDSRGLFQQRDNWGSQAERMDPNASAALFYKALLHIEGWTDLEPTIAAHRVQRNANPNHYEQFWDDAVQVVASITGQSPAAAITAAAPPCTDDTNDAAWASGADCDFANTGTPRNCTAALAEAARISRTSSCSNEVRDGSWRRRCLEFVARAYGYSSSGTATAKAQYRLLASKGMVHTGKNIPAGALVFFNSSDPAGHVAIYAGGGKAFSNDFIKSGCISRTPMTMMGAGGQYLGWSPPVFPLGSPL